MKRAICVRSFQLRCSITVNYSNQELVDNSVALHRVEERYLRIRIRGIIFSTSALIQNLVAADNNPKIGSHLLYVYSGGGEAYMLDDATNVIANLKKPVIAVTYKYNCSAAYHISCAADKIYATNRFDTIGCIGSMMSGLDIIPYFEKLGMKYYEIYADLSSEKNSRIRELKNGNQKPLVKEELNLLAGNFVDTVKNFRGITDKHVLAGQDYYANVCGDLKLIDGIITLDQAVGRRTV
ncbi:MAG: S49 family peptidase [Butyricimonas faecihominis]